MSLSLKQREMRKQARQCSGKHAYRSIERAERAAIRYRKDFPELSSGLNSYGCKFCGKFHIGHSDGEGNSYRARTEANR